VENAIIKARHASRLSGLPALADDSGLVVDALKGEPGIHSARYAGSNADREINDAANNALLLENLEQVPDEDRTARFQCCLALVRHADDPMPLICQGSWEGRILFAEQGEHGFGYDPLFYVPEHDCASAELEPAVKNTISHRAMALQNLRANFPA
jgi:XTP/dITP diphosphohydrolase